ncbi:MAG: hypothetical protein U0T83_03025 [Bacteriovoracaceae bacterium]
MKGYRTQDVGSITAEDLVQIGRDASDLEQVKSDPNLTEEMKKKKSLKILKKMIRIKKKGNPEKSGMPHRLND